MSNKYTPYGPEVTKPVYDINHRDAMVIINNYAEYSYICEVNKRKGVFYPSFQNAEKIKYPFAVSTNKRGGWTDRMDMTLIYVPFLEFVKAVSI